MTDASSPGGARVGEDIDLAVRAARRAFDHGDWALADPRAQRVLVRLAELMGERLEELAQIESRDTGHPIGDARRVDVPNADCIAWYAEAIDKVYGEIAPTGADALALVDASRSAWSGRSSLELPADHHRVEARAGAGHGQLGRVQAGRAVAADRAALAELAAEAGVPDGVLNVVPGFGEEAGQPLGSTRWSTRSRSPARSRWGVSSCGTRANQTARRFRSSLEAKAPRWCWPTPPISVPGEAIGWGIFYNAGQTCHTGSRVVVERALVEPLAERLVSFAREMAPGDPADPSTTLGALVSDEHLAGVLERVERAAGDGARLLVEGARAEPVPGGAYMEPTVLEALDPADPIVQEEVFGPVLAIQQADDAEHAVALANGTGYGLAAAVWSSNITTAHRVARRLRAGTVWINTFDVSSLATPFGGVKDSGHGRDRSLHALDAYTHLKTTWVAL